MSAKILVFSEMLLVLAASSFFIMASSHILLGQPLNQNVLFVFVTIGLLLVLYAIFAVDDANLVNKLQQILPLIGMSYVFLSFVSRPKLWKSAGRITAGFAVLGLTLLLLLPLVAPKLIPQKLTVIRINKKIFKMIPRQLIFINAKQFSRIFINEQQSVVAQTRNNNRKRR